MSTKNRGDRIQLLVKAISNQFTPVLAPEDRSVLEHLLYACCLEDATYEDADEAFLRLQQSYFDWNEVRVTTSSELRESLHNLPDPAAAASRVKRNLQSLFETRYSFDIDDMIRMNQGKAVQELERLSGMTKFVLGYVTQNALGGHSIPVSKTIMNILLATEIVSEAEAAKWMAPGLERTVPKAKGPAFASALHQFAIAFATTPGSKQLKAILKEAGAVEQKPTKKAATKESKSDEAKTSHKTPPTKKLAKSKPAASKPEPGKKTPSKKAASSKTKAAGKPAAKSAAKKTTKRKPR